MLRYAFGVLAFTVSAFAGPPAAIAQVPPHVPGEICFTPSFWCWASPPGLPGDPCVCVASDNSVVQGTLN